MRLPELTELVARLGLPKYRAVQLGDALYKQRVGKLEEITTLPTEVRERLAAEGYGVGLPEIVQAAKSVDGTERYLVRLADGETVETVWMPGGDGGERGDGSEAAVEEEGEAGDPDAVETALGGPTHRGRAAMNGAPGLVAARRKDQYRDSDSSSQNDDVDGGMTTHSSVDQLCGDQGEDQDHGGQHACGDEEKAGIEGAGVSLKNADDGGAEEAAEVAGAIDQGDAGCCGCSTEEGCWERPEHGDCGNYSDYGHVHADHGEDCAGCSLRA